MAPATACHRRRVSLWKGRPHGIPQRGPARDAGGEGGCWGPFVAGRCAGVSDVPGLRGALLFVCALSCPRDTELTWVVFSGALVGVLGP